MPERSAGCPLLTLDRQDRMVDVMQDLQASKLLLQAFFDLLAGSFIQVTGIFAL
jgi:hypothetical protein